MEYDDVIAAAFAATPPGVDPVPTQEASPARRLRDALEPIAMHSVWSRGTYERLAALGHDFMTGYVCSRAALMGVPDAGVVVSAFAVFEPNMLGGVYEAGRTKCDREVLLAARTEATVASLGAALGPVDGDEIMRMGRLLRSAVDAAPGTGRPLFSGLRNQPWPQDPIGVLWRSCEQFREHRGDGHVAVCVAAGLDAVETNVLTELWLGMPFGSYSATRGWDEAALAGAEERLRANGWVDAAGITAAGRSFRDGLETQTDRLQASIVASLGPELDPMADRLADWSQRCIDAKAFPPNVFKRAAG